MAKDQEKRRHVPKSKEKRGRAGREDGRGRCRALVPRALELIKAKQELDANRLILDFPEAGIQVLNGRYGPYITDKVKNAKIPKDREPKSLTLDECRELIAAAPVRGKGRFGRGAAKKTANAKPVVETKVEAKPKSAPKKKAATKTAKRKTSK